MEDMAQILAPASASLLGGKQNRVSASLPPIIPNLTLTQGSKRTKVGNKLIPSTKRARSWTWAPFVSSSRTDGSMFSHWVRSNIHYDDYPYAKFDIHMDPLTYSSSEYDNYLQSETWTRSETDRLVEMARSYECRWTIIFDRFCCHDASSTRKIEDLQHRYYGLGAILSQVRISREASIEARELSAAVAAKIAGVNNTTTSDVQIHSTSIGVQGPSEDTQAQEKTDAILEAAAARALATSAKQHQPLITHVGTGTSNKMFDYVRERERRQHLDRLWKRSKEDEVEELQLRKELKTIEAQLRKLKKNGGHILAAGISSKQIRTSTSSGLPNQLSKASTSRASSRSATPVAQATLGDIRIDPSNNIKSNNNVAENSQVLDEYFASTAPVPMPQYPYLQSGRLAEPSGMKKSHLARMDQVLAELGISSRPIPTKRVCDLYDSVRKDTLTLVTLQKMISQREGQLQSKRLKLCKLGGNMLATEDKVLDEERLFGIAPHPKPASSATSSTSNSNTSRGRSTKRKGTAVGGKSKAPRKVNKDSKNVTSSTTTKKKTVRRKRKADPSKNPVSGLKGNHSELLDSKIRTSTGGVGALTKSSIVPTIDPTSNTQGSDKKRARKS